MSHNDTTIRVSKILSGKLRTIGRLFFDRATAEKVIEHLIKNMEDGFDEQQMGTYQEILETQGLEVEQNRDVDPDDPEEQKRRESCPDITPWVIRGRNDKRSNEEILRAVGFTDSDFARWKKNE